MSDLLSRCQNILDRITYKKNVKLFISRHHSSDAIFFKIAAQVPDSENQENFIEVYTVHLWEEKYLSQLSLEELKLRIISDAYYLIRKYEEHEVNEFFNIDGKHYKDPHPKIPLA